MPRIFFDLDGVIIHGDEHTYQLIGGTPLLYNDLWVSLIQNHTANSYQSPYLIQLNQEIHLLSKRIKATGHSSFGICSTTREPVTKYVGYKLAEYLNIDEKYILIHPSYLTYIASYCRHKDYDNEAIKQLVHTLLNPQHPSYASLTASFSQWLNTMRFCSDISTTIDYSALLPQFTLAHQSRLELNEFIKKEYGMLQPANKTITEQSLLSIILMLKQPSQQQSDFEDLIRGSMKHHLIKSSDSVLANACHAMHFQCDNETTSERDLSRLLSSLQSISHHNTSSILVDDDTTLIYKFNALAQAAVPATIYQQKFDNYIDCAVEQCIHLKNRWKWAHDALPVFKKNRYVIAPLENFHKPNVYPHALQILLIDYQALVFFYKNCADSFLSQSNQPLPFQLLVAKQLLDHFNTLIDKLSPYKRSNELNSDSITASLNETSNKTFLRAVIKHSFLRCSNLAHHTEQYHERLRPLST